MRNDNELDKQFNGLTAQTRLADAIQINVKDIRPCVSRIWETSFGKGSLLNRSMASSILATELLRQGYSQQRVEQELTSWNHRNTPPLRISELRATTRTAERKLYNYSCNYIFLEEFCIGRELCSFSRARAEKGIFNFRDFHTYKWQLILSNVAVLIYWVALPTLEKRKMGRIGSLLYAGHREIALYAGITTKSVKKGLEELFCYGLIKYKAGTSRKWERNASEIKRVFPIPKPPKRELLKIEK